MLNNINDVVSKQTTLVKPSFVGRPELESSKFPPIGFRISDVKAGYPLTTPFVHWCFSCGT